MQPSELDKLHRLQKADTSAILQQRTLVPTRATWYSKSSPAPLSEACYPHLQILAREDKSISCQAAKQ